MTISDRIEMQRKRQGVSLTHLNNVIGAYRGKLTEVKNGKASLSDEEIRAISQALSTSTDYLLGNTDDPTPAGQKESSEVDPESGIKYPPGYELLTPENRAKADSYLAFLLAEQQSGQT